jgi:Flp pilus assembly protein TadG
MTLTAHRPDKNPAANQRALGNEGYGLQAVHPPATHLVASVTEERRFLRSERGVALIEFALFLPILTFLFVGIVDYALEIQEAMQIQEAAAAGAAYGTIPGNQSNLTGMQTAAQNAAAGISGFSAVATEIYECTAGGSTVTSSTTCSGYGTPITYVQVTTSATIPVYLAYPGMPSSLTLHGGATYRVPW